MATRADSAAAGRSVRARAAGRGPRRWRWVAERLGTDGLLIVLLIVWYVAALGTPEYILPDPLAVLQKSWALVAGDPALFQHTYVSLLRVVVSVVLALVIGAALALLARYVWILRGFVIERLMPTLNAFPTLGWAILGLYWFGVNDASVILVEVLILLPFAMINVWEGLKTLDPETMEMAHSFTRSRTKLLRKIVIPLILPYVFAALRISYGIAWKVSLIAELFGSSIGLGYLLSLARQQFDTSVLFATIVVLVLLVYAGDKLLFEPIERRLMRFRAEAASAL